MKKMPIILLVINYFLIIYIYPITINRVILATDSHPNYIQFWPIVARAWKEIIGVTPTLALIADETVRVDETLGEVIRFDPIPGIPTSLQAQVIRLLLPILFEDEVCIISDIDMIPLSKEYFLESVRTIPDDCFVVYRDKAYGSLRRFSICYNAAKGRIFGEIFNVTSSADIPQKISQWFNLGLGWHTDEIVLYRYLIKWKQYRRKCIKLGHIVEGRIDRSNWQFEGYLLQQGYYIDAHFLRPYHKYKKEIDALLSCLW